MSADFVELVSRADALMDSGQRDEALELAFEAEKSGHDPSDDLATAAAWNQLGTVLFRIGYKEKAERAYLIATAAKVREGDPNLTATLRNNLGQVCQQMGRLDDAFAHMKEAVALRERHNPDSQVLGVVLDNLGSIEHQRGNRDRAEALHRRALEIFTRIYGPLDTHVATVIGNLGQVALARREHERAEACWLRAFYTHLRASGPLASGTLINAQAMCAHYVRLGRGDEIDRLVNFLLSAGERAVRGSYRFLGEMLRLLAEQAFNQHRLDLTERLIGKAIPVLEATAGVEATDTLAARFERAAMRRAAGNLRDAEAEFAVLLDIYTRRDDERQAVRAGVELAKTYRDKGELQPARAMLQGAIERLRSGKVDDNETLASALGNLGAVAFAEDRYEEARQLYLAALESIGDADAADRPFFTYGLAQLDYHLGNLAAAERGYATAKARWTEMHGAGHPFVATCAADLALVHWTKRDMADALDSFREAAALRDEHVRRQLSLGSERQRMEYARGQLGDLNKIVSFCLDYRNGGAATAEFAAEALLRRKARVLDGIAQTFRLAHTSGVAEVRDMVQRLRTLQAAIARRTTPLGAGSGGDPGEVRRLRAELEALESGLSHEGAFEEAGLIDPSLSDVRSALPQGGVLVEYVRYRRFSPDRDGEAPWREDRYAACAIVADGPPQWFDLGRAAEIDSGIRKLRQLIDIMGPQKAILDQAGRLAHSLLAPFAPIAEATAMLLIAPDGLITLAPFEVLVDATIGLEKAPLTSFLVTGRDLLRKPEPARNAGIAVFANPDYGTVEPGGSGTLPDDAFQPLAGTEHEAAAVQALFPGARVITAGDATADALTGVDAPLILHVATHGFFSPLATPDPVVTTDFVPMQDGIGLLTRQTAEPADAMVHAGLALAGANRRDEAVADGIVTAREIAGMDLLGTQLVVLSACRTGVGHIADGEELTGLRRAFAIAGARSQLTSLWPVDDDATAALMTAFYERICTGAPRGEALRAAELAIRNREDRPEWTHPFYWAAFQQSGDWGAIPAAG